MITKRVIPILERNIILDNLNGSPEFSRRYGLLLSKIKWLVFLIFNQKNSLSESKNFIYKVFG